MILGEYSPGIYFQVTSLAIGLSIYCIYWISQQDGQCDHWYDCWISNIAKHYPEFILFRTSTIAGSVLGCLGWFTNYFYIRTVALEKFINIHKYFPEVILILGLLGSFALMGSTATIDTGKMNMDWHQHCAALAFIFTILAQTLNTITYCILLWIDKVAVSQTLVYAKLGQVGLLLIQGYIAAMNGREEGHVMFEKYGEVIAEDDLFSKKDIILEWTLTYTMCLGFFIMSFDPSNFKFLYEENQKNNNRVVMREPIQRVEVEGSRTIGNYAQGQGYIQGNYQMYEQQQQNQRFIAPHYAQNIRNIQENPNHNFNTIRRQLVTQRQ